MTIGGAISELNNLLKADDIPIYYKPSIKKVIETLEQEPKTGHWIKEGIVDANGNRNCRCSECGHGDIQAETQIVPYCWWCGAKMQKEGDAQNGMEK